MAQATILVIEDEPEIRRFLRVSLEAADYRLLEATDGASGIRAARSHPPDLVILDLGLPDLDGLEVIADLRSWMKAPIVILSARGQDQDKIDALDAGGDDYLTKPFSVGELLARIRVALRHAARRDDSGEAVVEVGELQVNLADRQVRIGAVEVRLTATEYRLLAVLARHAGRVVTHRQLLKEVWGPGSANETHYLRVYMAQLRRKLEADPAQPRYLLTEPAVGYRLASP